MRAVVCAALGAALLATLLGAARADSCDILLNGDLPEAQPVLLSINGSLLESSPAGVVRLQQGTRVIVACPGTNFNYLSGNEAIATCVAGSVFLVDNVQWRLERLSCQAPVQSIVRNLNRKCYGPQAEALEHAIGYAIYGAPGGFVPIITVCFNKKDLSAVYSVANVTRSIGGYQRGVPRPTFSFAASEYGTGNNPDTLYKNHTEHFLELLGNTSYYTYFVGTNHNLSRGHLVARADLPFGTGMNSTFHYVNAAPQWQTFNGGNWEALERSVRNLAVDKNVDLLVYTGTHNVLSLNSINGSVITRVSLYLNTTGDTSTIPVPAYFWKVVLQREMRAGVAFFGSNNHPSISSQNPCGTTRCNLYNWIDWSKNQDAGEYFCCDVSDFMKVVTLDLPFNVTQRLFPSVAWVVRAPLALIFAAAVLVWAL